MKLEGWIATDGDQFLACKDRDTLEDELSNWGFNAEVITKIHIIVKDSTAVITTPDGGSDG